MIEVLAFLRHCIVDHNWFGIGIEFMVKSLKIEVFLRLMRLGRKKKLGQFTTKAKYKKDEISFEITEPRLIHARISQNLSQPGC